MNIESQILQQVRILDPITQTDRIADVLISDGQIKAIESNLTSFPQEITVVNAQGLILGPGLVDLYSHSGEPGHEERETFASLAASAMAGGFTRVAILPDTVPPLDNSTILASLGRKKPAIQKNEVLPHFYFWGALTQELEGKQMTELADLAPEVVGFADGKPVENLGLLRRLLEYLKPLDKPIALVANNRQLSGNGVVREGTQSIRLGLPGNPGISEAAALAATLEVIAAMDVPVHLMRVSTRRGVELIADAKARGIPITASTTWMHLLLNTDAVSNYESNLRLNPPLGNESDMMALIEGVKEGVIEAIAVDHTPYTYEEKTVPFADAPPGGIGLELALPLLWQKFVSSGEWSALQLWHALSIGPQLCLAQKPSSLMMEQKAELILFDPQPSWIVTQNELKSRCANTPWLGKQITGRVVRVFN